MRIKINYNCIEEKIKPEWFEGLSVPVTVCDSNGVILFMNDLSIELFSKKGGRDLIGKYLHDCHPEPARSKLNDLLNNPHQNTYTIEKNGMRKMILQTPWYANGKYAGLVEISFPINEQIPHFVRD